MKELCHGKSGKLNITILASEEPNPKAEMDFLRALVSGIAESFADKEVHMHKRKPTRKEKQLITKYRLQPDNWLVASSLKDKLVLVHKHTDHERVIPEGIN